MSDEEKKAIHLLQSYAGMTHKLTDNQGRPKLDKAIDIVLNLIEKQQKEIEELKARNLDLESMLTLLNSISIDKKYVKHNYISKDKIKAKIEEYEDFGTSIYYGLRSNGKAFHQAVRMEVKEVLQSLLEKE